MLPIVTRIKTTIIPENALLEAEFSTQFRRMIMVFFLKHLSALKENILVILVKERSKKKHIINLLIDILVIMI